MATGSSLEPTSHVIEHGDERVAARWLRARRVRIALWIAVVEGILVGSPTDSAVDGDRRSRSRVVALLLLLRAATLELGHRPRRSRGSLAASQALAVVVVILALSDARAALRARRSLGALRRRSRARPAPRAIRPRPTPLGGRRSAVRPLALGIASVGRSQVVRQRVLVPRSQVRILAPQPSDVAVTADAARSRRHGRRPRHAHALGDARSTCTRCSAAGSSTGSIEAARAARARPARRRHLARHADALRRDVERRRPGASRAAPATPSPRRAPRSRASTATCSCSRATRRCSPRELLGRLLDDAPRARAPPRPSSRSSSPSRGAYGRIVRDGDGRARGDRRGARRDAGASSRSARSTPRSTSSRADALWPALERLDADNAQGELYLTDAVRHLVARRRARGRARGARPARGRGRQHARRAGRGRGACCATGSTRRTCSPGVDDRRPGRRPGSSRTSSSSPTATIQPFTVLRGATTVARGAEVGPHAVAVDAEIGAGALVGPFCYLRPGTRAGEPARRPARSWRSRTRASASARRCRTSRTSATPRSARARTSAPGTITANFPHEPGAAKDRTTIGSNVRTGVHNAFVAPVEIGDDAWIGGRLGHHGGCPARSARDRAQRAGQRRKATSERSDND